jgi:hypothetical protein
MYASTQRNGYTLRTRKRVREEGGFCVSGDERTCLADATLVILKMSKPGLRLSKERIRAALHIDAQRDPNFASAREFALTYGVDLVYDNDVAQSPVGLFRRTEGLYMVQLEITPHGHEPDLHCVVYDAAKGEVLDNEPGARVPVVDDGDRKSNKCAVRVYKRLFPLARVIRQLVVSRAVY